MDIRQLRAFLAISRHRNFTRAAEELRIAQPAVSMAVKKLEEELELVLFNRHGKQVSLTAEGEILRRHATRILDDLQAAQAEMDEVRGLGKGEVRVGIPPMLGAYFFPSIIRGFVRSYPDLHVMVQGEGAARIQRMIGDGSLDMGVIAGTGFPASLEARRFLTEEVVVCVPAGHVFAKRRSVTYAEFAREPLVFYREGYYLRELIFESMKEADVAPNIILETNLFSMVRALVRNGLGISIFLRMVVAGDADLAAVSFDPPLHLDLLIAWKKEGYLSLANRAFVEFLLRQTGAYAHPRGGTP